MTARLALPAAAFVLALAVRAVLIAAFPVMFWHDGYQRLAHAEDLVQGAWLPGYQVTIAALAQVTRDPTAHRLMTACQAAAAAAIGTVLFTRVGGTAAGALAGMVLALGPLLVFESVGLYPEAGFTALLLGGLLGLSSGSARASRGGVACLALATTFRFEGWIAAAVASAWIAAGAPGSGGPGHAWRSAGNRAGAIGALLAFPVAWTAALGGLTATGTDSLSPGLSWDRCVDQARILARVVPEWAGWGVLAWAAVGAWVTARRPMADGGVALALALLASAQWVVLVVAEPFWPKDSPRIAHLFWLVALALAVRGVAGAAALGDGRGRIRSGVLAIAALTLFPPIGRALAFLRGADGRPESALPAEAAGRLSASWGPEDRVLVVSNGFPEWPDEEPPACKALTVALAVPHQRVVCDAALRDGDAVDPAALRTWMRAEGIGWVAEWPGFEPWRPVHRAARGLPERDAVLDEVGPTTAEGPAARIYWISRP